MGQPFFPRAHARWPARLPSMWILWPDQTKFACSGPATASLPGFETNGEESDEGEITVSNCTALCCTSSDEAYHLTNKQVLSQLASKGRNFQPQWYKQFTWLTICTSSNKAFCLYCRYAVQHNVHFQPYDHFLPTFGLQCQSAG